MDKNHSEPPLSSGSDVPVFLIGRDCHGNWVAQGRDGLRGGLFVSRADAMKFALFENGNRRRAVVVVPNVVELDTTRTASTYRHQSLSAQRVQRAACAALYPSHQ